MRVWVILGAMLLLAVLTTADIAEYGTIVGTAEVVTSPKGENYPVSFSSQPVPLGLRFFGGEPLAAQQYTLWKKDSTEDMVVPAPLNFLAFNPGYGSEDILVGGSVNITSSENTDPLLFNRSLTINGLSVPVTINNPPVFPPPPITPNEGITSTPVTLVVIVEDRLGRDLPTKVPVNVSGIVKLADRHGAKFYFNASGAVTIVVRVPANASGYVLYNSSTYETIPANQTLRFQYLIPVKFTDLSAVNQSGKITVKGRLVDAVGAPVPNRNITVNGLVTRTDSNGYFEIDPAGAVVVSFPGDDVYLPASATVTVTQPPSTAPPPPTNQTTPTPPPTNQTTPTAPAPFKPHGIMVSGDLLLLILALFLLLLLLAAVAIASRRRRDDVVFEIK